MSDCIFCKIRDQKNNRGLPSEFLHEDDTCFAINDINPKARIHILIVSKKHIPSIAEIEAGDEQIIGHMVKTAKKLAQKANLEGYKLTFHVGAKGGQEVFHVHLHLMGS